MMAVRPKGWYERPRARAPTAPPHRRPAAPWSRGPGGTPPPPPPCRSLAGVPGDGREPPTYGEPGSKPGSPGLCRVEMPLPAPYNEGKFAKLRVGGDRLVSRTILPGGLRVVTEYVPHVRSVSIGFWLRAGSRY